MIYTPRPYQPVITNHIFDNPRCNVFAGMGMGKTPATLQAISDLLLFGLVKRVLVIAPKRVAQSTWPNEVKNFNKSFGHLRVAVAIGSGKSRKPRADEAERAAAISSNAEIVTINYDNVQWLVDHHGADWSFDMVVCDESTRLKGTRVSIRVSKSGKKTILGQGSVRGKALAKVAHTRVKRWVNLTGTPAPNGLEDLWGQNWFVDCGQRLGSSFSAFSQRWFRPVHGSTHQQARIEPLPHADGEIREKIKDLTIALEAKDFFDLPPLIENIIKVQLPPEARRHYKELEKNLFTQIAGHTIEALTAAAVSQKCLQLSSGATYVDDKGSWTQVHDAKLKALESVIEESAGMPVLVAYHFKSDLDRIKKAFPKAVELDSNPKTIELWNAGKIPLLVAHPQSAGHGLSLQHGSNILCFFSTNWNLEYDAQIIERLGPTRQAQSGYKRPVFIHRIVGESTIEEACVQRLKTKASVQDALMDAMKQKKDL